MAPSSLVEVDRRFIDAYCFKLQRYYMALYPNLKYHSCNIIKVHANSLTLIDRFSFCKNESIQNCTWDWKNTNTNQNIKAPKIKII
jgi:hypothetical protein